MCCNFVILGDLNYDCKLNETFASNPICYLEQLFMCNQLITEASRETQSTKTILDVILSTVPDSHTKSGVLKCGLSDHNFVYTVIGGRHSESQTRIVTFRKYKDFDADKFKEDLRDKMHALSLNSYSNIEESWTAF